VGAQAPAAPLLLLVLLPLLLLVLLPLLLVLLPLLLLVLLPLLLVLPLLLPLVLPLPLLLPDDEPPSSSGKPVDDLPAHPATWNMAATAVKPASGTAEFRRRMGVPPSRFLGPTGYWGQTVAARLLMQSPVTGIAFVMLVTT
jgi:hypothetical protein